MKKITTLGLCEGRHELPVEGYVFGNTVNPIDLQGMMNTAHEALQDVEALELYVTGLTVACTTVIRYCLINLIPLKLMHFDRDRESYYPQVILGNEEIFALRYDYGIISI